MTVVKSHIRKTKRGRTRVKSHWRTIKVTSRKPLNIKIVSSEPYTSFSEKEKRKLKITKTEYKKLKGKLLKKSLLSDNEQKILDILERWEGKKWSEKYHLRSNYRRYIGDFYEPSLFNISRIGKIKLKLEQGQTKYALNGLRKKGLVKCMNMEELVKAPYPYGYVWDVDFVYLPAYKLSRRFKK